MRNGDSNPPYLACEMCSDAETIDAVTMTSLTLHDGPYWVAAACRMNWTTLPFPRIL